MSKTVKMETKVVTATGWNGAQRKLRGETFVAPVDFKGSWFESAGSKDEDAQDALSNKSNIASVKPNDVARTAAAMTDTEINEAISVEQGSGSPRRNVLKQLQDELASRVGRVGGPDPAAKNPEEKDPLLS